MGNRSAAADRPRLLQHGVNSVERDIGKQRSEYPSIAGLRATRRGFVEQTDCRPVADPLPYNLQQPVIRHHLQTSFQVLSGRTKAETSLDSFCNPLDDLPRLWTKAHLAAKADPRSNLKPA